VFEPGRDFHLKVFIIIYADASTVPIVYVNDRADDEEDPGSLANAVIKIN
jgi:hypothetical protein